MERCLFLCACVFVGRKRQISWGGWQRRRMFVAGHNFVLERTKALPADGTALPGLQVVLLPPLYAAVSRSVRS